MDPEPYAVYAVELSSFQLHYTSSMSAHAAAVLNVAEDHLDWYVGPDGMADYAADKGRIFDRVQLACVYNVADPVTEQLVRDADVVEGARAIGFTLGTPGPRAWSAWSTTCWPTGPSSRSASTPPPSCARWPTWPRRRRTSWPTPWPPPPWRARSACRPRRCATGCAPSRPTATGSPRSPTVADVRYVDDSKATNPHAAASSLQAYEHVVWVAGGLAKGASFDDLVARVRDRLRGVVLLGRDRAVIAEALSRHAPDVPVIEVDGRGHFCHGPRGRGGCGARSARRHRAARPGMRVHGHVRELRCSRGCLRRGGPPARRPVSHPGFPADAPHGQEGSA